MISLDELDRRLSRGFAWLSSERAELEKRLTNWMRWSLQRVRDDGARNRCCSAERLYQSDKLTVAEAELRVSSMSSLPIDTVDAERVERAMLALRPGMRRLLIALYFMMRTPGYLARRLRMPMERVERGRARALMLLSRRLRILELHEARLIEREAKVKRLTSRVGIGV